MWQVPWRKIKVYRRRDARQEHDAGRVKPGRTGEERREGGHGVSYSPVSYREFECQLRAWRQSEVGRCGGSCVE